MSSFLDSWIGAKFFLWWKGWEGRVVVGGEKRGMGRKIRVSPSVITPCAWSGHSVLQLWVFQTLKYSCLTSAKQVHCSTICHSHSNCDLKASFFLLKFGSQDHQTLILQSRFTQSCHKRKEHDVLLLTCSSSRLFHQLVTRHLPFPKIKKWYWLYDHSTSWSTTRWYRGPVHVNETSFNNEAVRIYAVVTSDIAYTVGAYASGFVEL